MKTLNPLLLTKWEEKLLKYLDEEGSRPKEILKQSQIPNASAYLAFEKLRSRGLAVKKISNGKTVWALQKKDLIKKLVTSIEDKLGTTSVKQIKITDELQVKVHSSNEEVLSVFSEIMNLPVGTKVTILQGTKGVKNTRVAGKGEDYFIELNKKLSERNILCESIIPDDYFEDLIPVFGRKWAESYADRPNDIYTFPPELDLSTASFHLYKDKVFLYDTEEDVFLEIKNKNAVVLLQGMIEIIKQGKEKANVWEMIK